MDNFIQNETQIKEFNKTEIYKEKIEPIVQQLVGLCSAYDIPMFLAACVKDNGKTSEYKKEMVSTASHDIELANDIFPDLVAVTLGFTTIPPVNRPDIEFDNNAGSDEEPKFEDFDEDGESEKNSSAESE